MTIDYRVHPRQCPHEDFEEVEKPPLYLPPSHRCKACRLVWTNSTAPVKAWAERTGTLLKGERPPSTDDEVEPF